MKFLPIAIGLLMSISAAQSAQLGGLSVDSAKPIAEGSSIYSVVKYIRGSRWVGSYERNEFHLLSKAQGKNKVWQIDSAKKGGKLFLFGKEPARSILSLYEADCAEGRLRVLRADFYAGYFADGKRLGGFRTPEDWEYPQPGTNGIFPLEVGCRLFDMK